jgi:hypothetical protein
MVLPVAQSLGGLSEMVVYGAGICLVGLVLLGVAARMPQPAYRVLTRDPLSVRDLSMQDGPIEVKGTAIAEDDQTVESPFTETACLAYEYEAQELKSSGQSSYWETLDEGSQSVPFILEDESGRVRVDPAGATLELEDHTLRVSGGDEPPARIQQYIRETDEVERDTGSVDLLVTELDYGDDQRFIERRLDVGETAHIYGGVEPRQSGEWGSGLVDVVVTADETTDTYVISDSSEWRVAYHAGKRALVPAVSGVLAVLIGLVVIVGSL